MAANEFTQEKRFSWFPFEASGDTSDKITQRHTLDLAIYLSPALRYDPSIHDAVVTSSTTAVDGLSHTLVITVPTDKGAVTFTFIYTFSDPNPEYKKVFAAGVGPAEAAGSYGFIIVDAAADLYTAGTTYTSPLVLKPIPSRIFNPSGQFITKLEVANRPFTSYRNPDCGGGTITDYDDLQGLSEVAAGRVLVRGGKQCQSVVNRQANSVEFIPVVLPPGSGECPPNGISRVYTNGEVSDNAPTCFGNITSLNGVNVQEGTGNLNISGGLGVSIAAGNGASELDITIDLGLASSG